MDGLPHLPPTPLGKLGHEVAEAAGELANRVDLGEFDDLEDIQVAELRLLSCQMTQWASHIRRLEQLLGMGEGPTSSGGRTAFCN